MRMVIEVNKSTENKLKIVLTIPFFMIDLSELNLFLSLKSSVSCTMYLWLNNAVELLHMSYFVSEEYWKLHFWKDHIELSVAQAP